MNGYEIKNELVRAVDEIKPRFVVWENVPEIVNYIDEVRDAFGAVGYNTMWGRMFCAWEFGYPHRRKRFYGVAFADTDNVGLAEALRFDERIEQEIPFKTKLQFIRGTCRRLWNKIISGYFRDDDGLSKELVQAGLKAYGNAIVPDVAECIFRCLNCDF